MKIEHIAIWVEELEQMRNFYEKYFNAQAGERYHNPNKDFYSYFLSFSEGCRLELMKMPSIPETKNDVYKQFRGIIHFAITVGSQEKVDQLTETLRTDGFEVIGEPRTTGDGYYESVILDPEQNRVEIVA
ncbi:MAG: VOC family protein [Bacteroidota bacterium]